MNVTSDIIPHPYNGLERHGSLKQHCPLQSLDLISSASRPLNFIIARFPD